MKRLTLIIISIILLALPIDLNAGPGRQRTRIPLWALMQARIRPGVIQVICGNGVINGSEECDDGNTSNNDSCTRNCTIARCGDGIRWVDREDCDDGNTNNHDACLNNCRVAVCGDGIIYTAAEECDDSNTASGDLCDSNCQLEIDCPVFADQIHSFIVDSTDDYVDINPGDGECATSYNACTIRAAVMESNHLSGKSSIIIPANTYQLFLSGSEVDDVPALYPAPVIDPAVNDIDIMDHVVICGEGAESTIINGRDQTRLFQVTAGVEAKLANLTLTNGRHTCYGGAFYAGQHSTVEILRSVIKDSVVGGGFGCGGGGILSFNSGLTINNSTIRGNRVILGYSQGAAGGGIDASGGTLLMNNSSVIANNTNVSFGIAAGILLYGGTGHTITNSTIADNVTERMGGGIYIHSTSYSPADLTLTNTTVTDNTADRGGGIYIRQDSSPVTATVSNSLVIRNTGRHASADCEADGITLSVDGNSMIGRNTDCHGFTPVLSGYDTIMGTLLDSGEPGRSYVPLLPGSRAINAGDPATCPTTDQLGNPRIGTCDIGAVEFEPAE